MSLATKATIGALPADPNFAMVAIYMAGSGPPFLVHVVAQRQHHWLGLGETLA